VKFSDLPPDHQKGIDEMEIILRDLLKMPVVRLESDGQYNLCVSTSWLIQKGRCRNPEAGARSINGENHHWLVRAGQIEFDIYNESCVYGIRKSLDGGKLYTTSLESKKVIQAFLEALDSSVLSPLSLLLRSFERNNHE
jgi:hypothetical protein